VLLAVDAGGCRHGAAAGSRRRHPFASWAWGSRSTAALFALILPLYLALRHRRVENIQRHGPSRGDLLEPIPRADEVGGPTILATFTDRGCAWRS
jgi:hypothetical protein